MLIVSRFADQAPVSDADYVVQTAGALGVGELNLFALADRWWHGDDRPEKALERIFVHFLRTGIAPAWVRQFCRMVLDLANAGELDPRRFGVRPLRTVPLARLHGRNNAVLKIGLPALMFGVYLLLAASMA